jgi:hypothetical protein
MIPLSQAEMDSLREVGRGAHHAPIPVRHAERLLSLKLIYRLLGDLRITAAGAACVAHEGLRTRK